MSATAVNRDDHLIAIGGEHARAKSNSTDAASGVHVQRDDRFDVIERSRADHQFRSFTRLFRRLENPADPRSECEMSVAMQFGDGSQRAHGNGRMSVVATGVHDTRTSTAVIHCFLILNSQRIDVGSNRQQHFGLIGRAGHVGQHTATFRTQANVVPESIQ